jgi:hypothetical protein
MIGFGLDEYSLDNYLFILTDIITLSNASHAPSSVAIPLRRYSRFFPYRSMNLTSSWFFELFFFILLSHLTLNLNCHGLSLSAVL